MGMKFFKTTFFLFILLISGCTPESDEIAYEGEIGSTCIKDTDCSSLYCNPDANCAHPSCYDGWQNGYETGVDCGGDCNPCKYSYDVQATKTITPTIQAGATNSNGLVYFSDPDNNEGVEIWVVNSNGNNLCVDIR